MDWINTNTAWEKEFYPYVLTMFTSIGKLQRYAETVTELREVVAKTQGANVMGWIIQSTGSGETIARFPHSVTGGF